MILWYLEHCGFVYRSLILINLILTLKFSLILSLLFVSLFICVIIVKDRYLRSRWINAEEGYYNIILSTLYYNNTVRRATGEVAFCDEALKIVTHAINPILYFTLEKISEWEDERGLCTIYRIYQENVIAIKTPNQFHYLPKFSYQNHCRTISRILLMHTYIEYSLCVINCLIVV